METAELLQRGYRYALSLTHNSEEAQDLLQDAWVKVLAAEGPQHKGYLFATIRNAFVDRYRRGQVVQFEPHARTPVDAEARTVEESLSDRQLLDHVLEGLRPEEREAIYLSAVEGYTATEIGGMVDAPKNTVLSWLHRARKKVAAAFGAETVSAEVS